MFLGPHSLANEYKYVFWMEHDVVPRGKYWLDRLVSETHDDCLVKGSVYRGNDWDIFASTRFPDGMLHWINHINGNAIYKLNNDLLYIMNTSFATFNPNRGISFDIAVFMTIFDVDSNPERWKNLRNWISKYCYSDFIQNLGRSAAEYSGNPISKYPIFVHGSKYSRGNAAFESSNSSFHQNLKIQFYRVFIASLMVIAGLVLLHFHSNHQSRADFMKVCRHIWNKICCMHLSRFSKL
jgi:hypothetical protein